MKNASVSDWARCLGWLRESEWSIVYSREGRTGPIPEFPAALFQGPGQLISVNVGGLVLNTHLFSPDEIEFDIDPREITSEARFGSLLSFLGGCGRALAKEAIITPENYPDGVILRYLPEADEIEYVPAA